MATAETELVACVRCAVAAAHPNGYHPIHCPACGRDRRARSSA
jgi:predicted RNA-binding Zn-ribbon protein involved in translation (DUF1610 family)